jgi:phosphoribosylformylglycinamidine cyclo-ligase
MGLTYEETGVDYGPLDAFKRAAQRAASGTTSALSRHGLSEPGRVRGESAYLLEGPDGYLAHVEEGLGTKNLVADAVQKRTGVSHYRSIGIDLVATIVNDLVTCGALPVSLAMHAAVGDATFFGDETRARDLADGFAEGCRMAGAVWGGGETPALPGIVEPDVIVLAGSALGRIAPKSNRIVGDVEDGDAIVLLASSGVQTNGLSLCRAVAERLPDGYGTLLPDGTTYGEALLAPSVIYVSFVEACQRAGVHLKYAAHVTGHGFRKLMRLDAPFVHRIEALGPQLPIFDFLVKSGHVDLREAYATFNMGAGFGVWVAPGDVDRVLDAARSTGHRAWRAGVARRMGDRKAVEIAPLGIAFEGEELQVR